MTETTQIEAGRELDALVAVEVMGVALEQWALGGYDIDGYSTTGDGMLAVLERMRVLGWRCVVIMYVGHTEARFYPCKGGVLIHAASADTLPHAVCLAALEAVRA